MDITKYFIHYIILHLFKYFFEITGLNLCVYPCFTDGVCQLCPPPAALQPHSPPCLWHRCIPAHVCLHLCGAQRRGKPGWRLAVCVFVLAATCEKYQSVGVFEENCDIQLSQLCSTHILLYACRTAVAFILHFLKEMFGNCKSSSLLCTV